MMVYALIGLGIALFGLYHRGDSLRYLDIVTVLLFMAAWPLIVIALFVAAILDLMQRKKS